MVLGLAYLAIRFDHVADVKQTIAARGSASSAFAVVLAADLALLAVELAHPNPLGGVPATPFEPEAARGLDRLRPLFSDTGASSRVSTSMARSSISQK